MNETRILKKEMALTRKMFFDTLPRALDSTSYTLDGDTVTLVQEGRVFILSFTEKSAFKLGGFVIPKADITLEFSGYNDEQFAKAVKRFDRYFHRGGG